MKLLLIGGTGVIGSNIIKILDNTDSKLYITTRKNRINTDNINYIIGNAHDYHFIKNILNNDYYDCIIDFMIYSTDEFKKRIEDLLKSTSHYFYLSSARVYADSDNPITENSLRLLDVIKDRKYLQSDEYALAKARQEDIIKSSSYTNWTIIRPYITYGDNRFQLASFEKEYWLYRALMGKTIVFPEEMLYKKTTFTYAKDVAIAINNLINRKEAFSNIFNIVNGKYITWNDIINIYKGIFLNILNRDIKIKYISLENFYKIAPNIYQVKYDRMYNRIFNNEKILKYTNIDNFLDVQDGLNRCLSEYLINNKEYLYFDWKNEAFQDKILNERSSTNSILGLKNKIKYLIFRYL